MVLALQDLFHRLEHSGAFSQFQVRLSYLEVYNETVRDLLNPQPKPLDLRWEAVAPCGCRIWVVRLVVARLALLLSVEPLPRPRSCTALLLPQGE